MRTCGRSCRRGLVDVHAHLGEDASDGSLDLATLLATMEAGGVTHTCAFSFRSPPGAGYGGVNADVIAAARASGGRVTAFVRSEPGERFQAELEEGLAAGARGIKLHTSLPGYDFSHPDLGVAFALAAEARVRSSSTPVVPCRRSLAISRASSNGTRRRRSCSRIAPSPTSMRSARCATRTSGFDTSLWNSLDVRTLLAEAAPEQLLYGSDAPCFSRRHAGEALPAARGGRRRRGSAAGRGRAQRRPPARRRALRAARRTARDRPAAALAPAPARARRCLVMAVPLIWQQAPDRIGLIALARQALGDPADERASAVLELLALAEAAWPIELEHGDRSEILDRLVAHVPAPWSSPTRSSWPADAATFGDRRTGYRRRAEVMPPRSRATRSTGRAGVPLADRPASRTRRDTALSAGRSASRRACHAPGAT